LRVSIFNFCYQCLSVNDALSWLQSVDQSLAVVPVTMTARVIDYEVQDTRTDSTRLDYSLDLGQICSLCW